MFNGLLLLSAFFFAGQSQPVMHTLTPQGHDFQKGKFIAYLSSIHQMETDGQFLYFRGGKDEYVLITDFEGKVLDKIGGRNDRPSEFNKGGVLAIAMDGSLVAVLDKGISWIRFYENQEMVHHLKPEAFNRGGLHNTSNAFAFSPEYVVMPTNEEGYLGKALGFKSQKNKNFGETLDFPLDKAFEEERQATLWTRYKDFWIAAHKFFPVVTVFDKHFNMVNQYQLDHPRTNTYQNYIATFEPGLNFSRPQPVFTDMKIYKDHLFLMISGQLFQVEPMTGAILSTTRFVAKGEAFGEIQGMELFIPFFCFSPTGKLFLGHPALLWEHDFWSVDLPFLKASGQP